VKDLEITMTDTENHDDRPTVKYTPVSYQCAALLLEFEFRLISPFGLQYDRNRCAEDWDREERRDDPFNWEYFRYGPQKDWNPINLGQQIELCAAYFNLRRRLKGVKRGRSSYGVKHHVERHSKTYVVNGAVIMAATRLGLTIKPTHHESPNAFFNIGALLW
jgi:hypothetical protein